MGNISIPKRAKLSQAKEKILESENAFCVEIFTRAVRKTEVWMKNAFGRADWGALEVDTIVAFYFDTLRDPKSRKTFNRGFA